MLLASTIISALASPALAACHTLPEARAKWRDTYLRYSIEAKQKCWFPGKPLARVIRARMPMHRPDPTPQQRINAAFWVFIIIEYEPPCWADVVPRMMGTRMEAYLCRLPPEAF